MNDKVIPWDESYHIYQGDEWGAVWGQYSMQIIYVSKSRAAKLANGSIRKDDFVNNISGLKCNNIGEILIKELPDIYAMKSYGHNVEHHPEGGVYDHTLEALRANNAEDPVINLSILFHDVGKIGMPGKPLYIKNDNRWEIEKRNMRYKTNPELVRMSLAARSLYLVSKYIPLCDAEAQAILYHDGQYIEDNKTIAHKEEPLTLLAHWADYWTAHIYEEGRSLQFEIDCFRKD